MWVVFLLLPPPLLFSVTPALAEPGFSKKYERDFNPASLYAPDNPLNPAQTYAPDNPFNPANHYDPGNPVNPANRFSPNNLFNPANQCNPDNPPESRQSLQSQCPVRAAESSA